MAEVILLVIAFLVALTATILAFIFLVPEKRKARLNSFGKFLHETLNFKYLVIEKVMQALYIFSTAFTLIYGFIMLFQTSTTYDYNYYTGILEEETEWLGWAGLLMMILGPIAVRLSYEMIMMAILLVKNVIQINNKLKTPDTEEEVTVPAPTSYAPQRCPTCGANVANMTFCNACGTRIR